MHRQPPNDSGSSPTPLISEQVAVQTPSASYVVHIGTNLLADLGTIASNLAIQGSALLVADDNLPQTSINLASESLEAAGFRVEHVKLHATETQKVYESVQSLLDQLAKARFERSDVVIALGGGIVGDVAGFAAAVYRRGIPVIQCPTTLLAMVDASVGGKTGINLPARGTLLKNMVGSFHHPKAVIADVSTLNSLPPRFFRSGLAECIKHGLLCADHNDPELLSWTREHLSQILKLDSKVLCELVARNVAVKASVIAADEHELNATRDNPGRAVLNLGHTFAHAIEPVKHLTPTGDPADAPLHHGEAVGLGLIAAASYAECAGMLDQQDLQLISDILIQAGLIVRIAGLDSADLIMAAMQDDKKVQSGELRLIIPGALGRCCMIHKPNPEHLIQAIDAIRA